MSTIDALTDIYVIRMYYGANDLRQQANALLAMISINMIIQITLVLAQYQKKSWKVKLKEVLVCLLFLRPAVDAFRVSTNYKDDSVPVDPLTEMIANKVRVLSV